VIRHSATIQRRKFLASWILSPLGDTTAFTVGECALPGVGTWPAFFAIAVESDCHAAAIHERAVLRSVRCV
jgi:hypothetical protein